jgi:hypothetical protein
VSSTWAVGTGDAGRQTGAHSRIYASCGGRGAVWQSGVGEGRQHMASSARWCCQDVVAMCCSAAVIAWQAPHVARRLMQNTDIKPAAAAAAVSCLHQQSLCTASCNGFITANTVSCPIITRLLGSLLFSIVHPAQHAPHCRGCPDMTQPMSKCSSAGRHSSDTP